MGSKFKYEYLLVAIAIAWVIVFSHLLQLRSQFTLEGDEGSYYSAAKNFYLHLKIDDGRPLFISIINGFPFLFGCTGLQIFSWILGVNLLCWMGTTLLIFRMGSEKANRKTAFFISLIFLFCIGNLAITYKLLSESVFVFLLVLSIYWINRYTTTSKPKFLTLTIALLLLMALVKPLSIGLAVLLILFYIRKWNEIIGNTYAFFILMSVSLLWVQMYSVKKSQGDFTISYIDSFTYYNYLGTRADCLKNKTEFVQGESERYAYFTSLTSTEQRKVANDDFKNQLVHNPVNLLKAYGINMYINSSKGSSSVFGCVNDDNTSYFDFFHFSFKTLSKLQNILFTAIGICLSFFYLLTRKRQAIFYLIISVTVLYIFFVSAISSDQGDRFHIVLFPLIILLGLNIRWLKDRLIS